MKVVFDMNESRSKRFSCIMDKLKDEKDVNKLLNLIMGEGIELFISTFSDDNGNLDLREATTLPSKSVRQANEKAGKPDEEHDALILGEETMMGHQYYRVYDKQKHMVCKCPVEDVIIKDENQQDMSM